MRKNGLVLAAVAAALMAGVAAPDARADDAVAGGAARASALTDEAMALYKAHDYRHALEKFLQAHALDPDPNLLFNMGRCYELLGDVDAAIDKYDAFLSTPGGDPGGRHKAEESLATLRKVKASNAVKGAPAPAPAAAPPDSASSGAWARTAGWISLGVGVAAGVGGTLLYLSGASDQSQVTGARGYGQPGQIADITQASAQSLIDRGNTKKTMGGVLWGVGGAGVAGAVVLFLVGRSSHESPAMAVDVTPSVHGGSLTLGGTF
jgi:hypothetical protein